LNDGRRDERSEDCERAETEELAEFGVSVTRVDLP
jgi:hypothetical protein